MSLASAKARGVVPSAAPWCDQVFDRCPVAVAEHGHRPALGHQVPGHAVAHQADTDETDPLAHSSRS